MSNKIKYKPSKTGKIAIGVTLSLIIISLIFDILAFSHFLPRMGFIFLISSLISNFFSQIAIIFLLVDFINFQKINNPGWHSNKNIVLGVIIGILSGIFWRIILNS